MAKFNSIFAVSSIPMGMKYYEEFKAHLDESLQKLRIATIFSFSSTTDALPDEGFENEKLDKTLSRLFG